MSWPTPQDYSEAVQNPHINFDEPQLKSGAVSVTTMGLPVVASGSFASVYRISCNGKLFAIRCFLKDVPGQHERYDKISRYVMSDTLPYTVDFNYIQRGVLVHGQWYPVLKMDWVDGVPLDGFVRGNIRWGERLLKLADQFKVMMSELQTAGIAHGDLQHGNIMITREGELRLVDYDGMYVPELEGQHSTELGHRNYQHPSRDAYLFDPRMDNFSAWSIYTSLVALGHDPSLAPQLNACDECLLFRQADYRYPLNSNAFAILEGHENEQIRTLARTVRTLLAMPADQVPFLSEDVKPADDLPPVKPETSLPFEPPATRRVHSHAATTFQEEDLEARRKWPALTEYMHALTNPARNFIDPSMQSLLLVRDHGSVRAKGTDHGAVFRYQRLHQDENHRKPDILVKVWLHADELIEQRYKMLYTFLHGGAVNYGELDKHFADFTFIPDGLRVKDHYYPIVRMKLIKGRTLWEAVDRHREDRMKMRELAQHFLQMMALVESSGIVHGDIEPENVIVKDEHMVLIDYDLTTVPHGRALASQVPGNRHYRHPKLPKGVPAPNDNFASWLMYYSLKIIMHFPVVWNIAGAKPGRLLFHADDLRKPEESHVFSILRSHYNPEVRKLGEDVLALLQQSPDEIPPLRIKVTPMKVVESIQKVATTPLLPMQHPQRSHMAMVPTVGFIGSTTLAMVGVVTGQVGLAVVCVVIGLLMALVAIVMNAIESPSP